MRLKRFATDYVQDFR